MVGARFDVEEGLSFLGGDEEEEEEEREVED